MLILATIAFSALGFISFGPFSIFIKIFFYGFLFLFMQNIIHTTASDENEPLGFPNVSDFLGGAFQLAAVVAVSFGIPIALFIAKIFFEVEIPMSAIMVLILLGSIYFPMAFLAVAMKDSVLAANPMVVIPAILKMPLEYLVTAILSITVYGVRVLGNMASGVVGAVSMSTRNMDTLFVSLGGQAVWAFISIYLLTVNMRILGLLYISKKQRFGWFSR